MLGFIDCGLLAKEIAMIFPEENNITPDIYSAINSLSMIILGSDHTPPSLASQKNFCKTLRNIVEQLFKLQNGDESYKVNEVSLNKVEELAQQALDWRISFNSKNQLDSNGGGLVDPVAEKKSHGDASVSSKTTENMEEGESTGGGPGGVLYKMLDDEGIKSLICIHALCWGTSYTAARFKALYPAYAISKSGITTWVKHFSTVLAEGQCPIKQSVGKFEALTPNEIPLRYIYEIRQRILHKRNVLRYKIFRMDIPRFVKEVLEDHGLMEKFGQWAGNEVFCDRLFNVSSKMNMELRHGAVKEFFENNPKWFID